MAGSVTITHKNIINDPQTDSIDYLHKNRLVSVTIDWIGDAADGSVPITDIVLDAKLIDIIGRYCILGITDPGNPAPTALYDIEILDEYGIDIFGGTLKDRSTINSEQTVPQVNSNYIERLCASLLTFKLTNNSVVSAVGKCVLYFKS